MFSEDDQPPSLPVGLMIPSDRRVWCDACGVPLSRQDALSVTVLAPTLGIPERTIIGCTRTHLRQIQTGQWPAERSWLARIRVMSDLNRPLRLTDDEMAIATDLTPEQVRRAETWHVSRLRQWQRDYIESQSVR
jgi:hypothetical protein